MEEFGESLYLEHSKPSDRAVATLVRRVLGNTGRKESGGGSEPGTQPLSEKLEEWLREGNIRPILLLSFDEVISCMDVIQSQVEIAEETQGANHPQGTSVPNDIRLANRLLPDMQEFVAGQVQSPPSE